MEIAGVGLPDSALCLAATELAREASEPFLFHHVLRSAVYAQWLAERSGAHFDREVLYISTILHDLGLTSRAPARERFEVEGADAAQAFLTPRGASARMRSLVWDAIALHTTAGIPLRKDPEVAFCHLGITCDMRGIPGDRESEALSERVREALPWLALHDSLPGALVGLYRKNPAAAASHAVSDACERHVAGFRRFNLCDVLLTRASSGSPSATP